MQQMPPFTLPITIYYEDTDIGGLVYHANYLKFFERARTEQLRARGVNQQRLLQEKIAFVVTTMEINFVKGATLDDQLIVESTVIELKRASITFLQRLIDSKGLEYCRAKVKIACINTEKMKPIAIPTSIQSEILSERRNINS